MENLLQDIDNIISLCNKQINEKVQGINYFESLKYLLINKLKEKNLNLDFSNNISSKSISHSHGCNNFKFQLEYNKQSISKIKNTLNNINLSIVLSGKKSIQLFENKDSDKSIHINLHKFMGVVLPENTIISENLSKNTIILDILSIKSNSDIEN